MARPDPIDLYLREDGTSQWIAAILDVSIAYDQTITGRISEPAFQFSNGTDVRVFL